MFKNFCKLNVQGKCFQNETILEFFKENHHRFCLIYGKNGSGKSTISQAFNALKTNDPNFITSKILDKSSQEIELAQDQKDQIFVFNEKYIDEKIKIKDDGLDAIVLFGGAVEIDTKLKKLQNICDLKTNRKNEYENRLKIYSEIHNTDNPQKYENKIVEILKAEFAERERDILGNKNKILQNKTIDFAKDIFKNYATQADKEQLKSEFNNKLSEYKKIRNDITFDSKIEQININDIKRLLSYQVKQTSLNEEQEQIKQVIQNEEVTRNIMSSNREICPYCFSKLTNEYKQEILSILENIFNKDIQNHKQELGNQKNLFNNFQIPEQMNELDNKLFSDTRLKLEEFKKQLNSKIDEKIERPFVPLVLDENFADEINQKLAILEKKRQEFQEQKAKSNELRSKLEILNKKITFLQIEQDFKDYQEKLRNKNDLESKNAHNNKRLECIKKLQEQLNSQKAQIKIAQDQINKHLKYIFFDENRLQLETKDEQYVLKSKQKSVKTKDVSTGERNAIALSYFFTEIFSNESESELYKKPKFIVIDDPISSFDFENKVGIMSFLNYQIKQIINGCNTSKMVVLTHDLMSAFDLQKIIRDLPFCQKELKEQNMFDFDKKYSEYKMLLQEIYNYANNSTDNTSNISIGNIMRKVLEAFGTFNYQCGIDKIVTDELITSNLQPEEKKYFENLMYRLVLHGESHAENRIKALDFFSHISQDEKIKTAKDVLSLLYLLHKTHLQKYLDESEIENIKEWSKSCKN
ncbi:hypothetical protein CR66_04020 [Campylobacter mucosalis]|uniref:AAA family ATPase n=1 Tax=Campylobacter mucosalis TaxID=202 RepID=UPI0004DABFAD|nr:AAA family ATPase [Campylobacter mucosalis]KEA45949.1 hypothetical protein CR66_04020 [Campylobacter mucosalis]QKF63638.1 ATP-binding protein (AAA domain) [Campylobacter mucosalis]